VVRQNVIYRSVKRRLAVREHAVHIEDHSAKMSRVRHSPRAVWSSGAAAAPTCDGGRHAPFASNSVCARLGVGPIWPWYLLLSSGEPYGRSTGVDIRMKLSWPIFMP